ncbi:unnamed protein product [Blepharisma stoltei]|uniref:Rab-GAP TBC domain-containing protein n=1 Tax=Blepharisma stoltei TaxID=1481888 RepID=A0AAU9IHC5_9CILI|nr:unnamed protein product [Blepharisma stoltei]
MSDRGDLSLNFKESENQFDEETIILYNKFLRSPQSLSTLERNYLLAGLLENYGDLKLIKTLCCYTIGDNNLRAFIWKRFLKYMPFDNQRSEEISEIRKMLYNSYVKDIYLESPLKEDVIRCIELDIPRTINFPLINNQNAKEAFKRLLYILCMKHKNAEYQSGFTFLCVPLFVAYLSSYDANQQNLSDDIIFQLEVDVFYSLSEIFKENPWISSNNFLQQELDEFSSYIKLYDQDLDEHLSSNEIQANFYAYRWLKCLFTLDFPVQFILKVWDVLISCDEGFRFSIKIAAAVLLKFRENLLSSPDMAQILTSISNIKNYNWTDNEIEMVISHAFMLN